MTDVLIVVDGDDKIKKVNQAAQDMLGLTENELNGQSIAKVLGERILLNKEKREGKMRDFDVIYERKNGEKIPFLFSVSSLLDLNKRPVGDIYIGKNISERKKISESKKKLYSDYRERKKLGDAIRVAKSDPIKYQNHCLGQKKRYSDLKERQKMHDANTQKKCVRQFTLDGQFIKEFPSVSIAVQKTGILNIKQVAAGKRPKAGGFVWKYV